MDPFKYKPATIPAPPHHNRYLVEHGTCPICETDLKIYHDINKSEKKVKEEAYCPQCTVRARSVVYDLH